jgi:hypothetical protein
MGENQKGGDEGGEIRGGGWEKQMSRVGGSAPILIFNLLEPINA